MMDRIYSLLSAYTRAAPPACLVRGPPLLAVGASPSSTDDSFNHRHHGEGRKQHQQHVDDNDDDNTDASDLSTPGSTGDNRVGSSTHGGRDDVTYWHITDETTPFDKSILVEDGLLKAVLGRTWPGIEFGEPPRSQYSFFQYVDAIRFGDLEQFKHIQHVERDWWFVTLDRGAGGALHFAADHGKLDCARYLIEELGAEVNQQDRAHGWTPLHRCARMAHVTDRPYMKLFEYLLEQGADPDVLTDQGWDDILNGGPGSPQSIYDMCVDKGRGWRPGRVRNFLRAYVEKHRDVPKRPVFRYEGPEVGPGALAVMKAWALLPPAFPPDNWLPPPDPGFVGSRGMRFVADEPWRPAGSADDGSEFLTPLTTLELDAEEQWFEEDFNKRVGASKYDSVDD